MRKILRFLVPLLLVGAGVAIFMQLKSSGPEDMPAVVTERQWPVDAVRVEFRELRPTVRLYGRLESPAESKIRSALSTDVSASFALVGKAVAKGDVLLQLDDVDATLALAQREAELAEIEARIESENSRYRNDLAALTQEQQLLALAQNALARAEKLAQTQAGTQANVDNAREAVARQTLSLSNRRYAIADHPPRLAQLQARRQQAQAQRDQAARNLERTRVTAPFAGRITAVHVSVGDRVRPGDRLVDLFDTTSLEVRAQVPNRHLNAIRQSLADGITIDATAMMDGSEFTLELARLSAKIESGEGGVDACNAFLCCRATRRRCCGTPWTATSCSWPTARRSTPTRAGAARAAGRRGRVDAAKPSRRESLVRGARERLLVWRDAFGGVQCGLSAGSPRTPLIGSWMGG